MLRRKHVAMVAALAAFAVAGCGSDDNGSDSASGGNNQQAAGGGTIKIGFLSDCEGAFGSFFEPTASGANLALIKHAGAKPAGDKPTDGVTGAKIAGKDVEIVSYGCADDTADKAIEETRRMMEQEDADIMIGPLSGDEGIAVANYAKEHPDKTFINGISGAQDTTLKVQAPNFFRFHPDGAQWSAGLGDYAYNELGWKNAAIIGDDYSFPYTSLAGFVAEFCAIGGQIPKRVWAPLGEEDYSSYISQIPEDVDGLYVGIGGSGLISFIKQYEEQRGRVDTERMLGNVFWDDPLVLKEVGKSLVGGVTAAMTAADSDSPEVAAYIAGLKEAYGDEIAGAGPSVFTYGYYTGMTALIKALEEVGGDVADQSKLQAALAKTTLTRRRSPVGRRQARRQPPGDLERLPEEDRRRRDGRRRAGRADVRARARGRPDLQRRLLRGHAGARPGEPGVRGRRGAAVGRQVRRRELREVAVSAPATAPERADSILRLRGIDRRFGGVHAVRGVDLEVRPGERRAVLGPNGAGKTTVFNLISGEFPPSSGRVELFGHDVTLLPARKRARMGLSRTFQTSRLFAGLSVEDNLYLAVLGVGAGHLRIVPSAKDGAMREKARAMGAQVGLAERMDDLVMDLSHGEQRQLEVGMALVAEPKLLMLDEPAAGLSRAERVKLTDMLTGLDASITLILIEHDMDVALRVAQWVTMMHDGRVIVEGTPEQIRANQTVHDLYLGSGLIAHE